MKRSTVYDILALLVVVGILLFLGIPYLHLFIAFGAILIYCYKRKELKNRLGFERPKSWSATFALAIALGVCISLLSYFVFLPLIEKLTSIPLRLGAFGQIRGSTGLLISSLLLGWIVGGLMEETTMRAFMITRFENIVRGKSGTWIGIIISSVLFGYLHKYQGVSGQFLSGFVGLQLAIIYQINKQNIWLNIFTHGFVNTFSFLMLYFDVFKI